MRKTILTLVILTLLSSALAAGAAVPSNQSKEPEAPPPAPDPAEDAVWQLQTTCDLNHAAEVQGYRIVCTNATFLDGSIADVGIAGDHWQLKVRSYDVRVNTAVCTAPGALGAFSVAARVFNQGGTAQNPGGLIAYAECTYPSGGINVFPAGASVVFASDGNCTVVADPLRARIDRSP